MTEEELREHVRDALVEIEPDGTYVYPSDDDVDIAIELARAVFRRAKSPVDWFGKPGVRLDDVRVERARRACRASRLIPAVLLGGGVGYFAAKKI